MDTRLNQPVGAPALMPARIEPPPARQAVRTELEPPRAVAAQAGAEQARLQREKREPGMQKQTDASYDIDRETGELIYKVIDQETDLVLSQYPYEGLLKLRAYIKGHSGKE